MRKIAITGGKGVIGLAIQAKLRQEYTFSVFDLPEFDVRNYEQVIGGMSGHDAVIHLAWDTKTDNWNTGRINPDNERMAYNVYQAASELNISRVIMASSVHADRYRHIKPPQRLDPRTLPVPDSPYGAGKVFMEALGRYYAANNGLEVICLRFGGVVWNDQPPVANFYERAVWLSHNDCAELIRRCIEIRTVPDNYEILYAISEKPNRIHDYTNRLGWVPKDWLDT